MKIVSVNLKFTPATAPDVTGYKLYHVVKGEELGVDSPVIDLGMPALDSDSGKMIVTLKDIPEIAGLAEGTYTLGVSAYDDVGNESDMSIGDLEVDFTAPDPPGPLTFESE
jgi:hypothetical protein